MIDKSSVTVIIPHLGGTKESEYALSQCLLSLEESSWPAENIIVSVNGGKCQEHYANVKIDAQGQEKAVNAAATTVNTPWIFVTNDDMQYAPGWWEELTFPMEGREEILCISPKLIEPRAGAPTFEVYFCGGAGGDFDKQKWLEFAKNYKKNEMPLRTGFNLPFLIKKELWDLINGYDVNFSPWGSNSDSCLQTRIMLAGVQPYQNTNAIVYHFSQTSGTGREENRPYWQKNWDYYIEKYGFERASSPEIWVSQNIIDWDKLKFKPWWLNFYKK